jgi:hypothetical protein
LDHGCSPVPLGYREKACYDPGWESRRLTAGDLDRHFPEGERRNVGVHNGELSRNLADVDLDTPEAIAVAPHLLPPTGWRFGRRSARLSHWVYRTDRPLDTASVAFRDVGPTADLLLELRGTGGQTVFPGGSCHEETGEPIEWHEPPGDEPAHVTLDELRRAVGELAAAALLVQH